MRIAQVAPLYESVPPKLYGGTERVVSFLTEELVRQGHDVTLFASGDSLTSANLVSTCQKALRLDPNCRDALAHHYVMLERVMKVADQFDIVHFHVDYLHFPLSRHFKLPQLTTLHGRLDSADLKPIYAEFSEMPVVSISNHQRQPISYANWAGTAYHGLPKNHFKMHESDGEYLAFLGRISPEKRPDRAIEIAIKAGIPLKIAAKIDKADQEYFDQKIKHLLDHPLVEFIGEIGEHQKNEFLGRAKALLFPIDWPEPFGLVVIEAMACGTPVIAFPCGSVPELVEHGKSGFIVENIEEAVSAVHNISQINRQTCRQIFEERFSVERMAYDYLGVYEKIIREHKRTTTNRIFESNTQIPELRGPDIYLSELPLS